MTKEEIIEFCEMKAELEPENEDIYEAIIKVLENCLDGAREDFMSDVYNTLDFLPTNEEANMIIDSFDRVTSGIRQEPCEDCISREAALEQAMDYGSKTFLIPANSIKALPSVRPKYTDEEIDRAQAVEQAYIDKMVELAVEETKRPNGKWERFANEYKKCSNCGKLVKFYRNYNYCPYCGAKMIEPQDKTKQGLAYADQDTLMSAT